MKNKIKVSFLMWWYKKEDVLKFDRENLYEFEWETLNYNEKEVYNKLIQLKEKLNEYFGNYYKDKTKIEFYCSINIKVVKDNYKNEEMEWNSDFGNFNYGSLTSLDNTINKLYIITEFVEIIKKEMGMVTINE